MFPEVSYDTDIKFIARSAYSGAPEPAALNEPTQDRAGSSGQKNGGPELPNDRYLPAKPGVCL